MKKFWQSKYFRWGFTALITIVASILFIYLIFMGKDFANAINSVFRVLTPIIDGLAIAYIATPVLNFIEQKIFYPILKKCKADITKSKTKKKVRAISVILTLIFMISLIYAFFKIVIPQLVMSVQNIIISFPIYLNNLEDFLEKFLKDYPDLEKNIEEALSDYSTNLKDILNKNVYPKLNEVIKSVSLSVLKTLKALYYLIIGFIISVYVLASKETFAAQAKKIIFTFFEREKGNQIIDDFRFINKTFTGFLSGKIVDSIIIGILCFIGTSLLNIPYAVLVSVIVGVTNIIPFFGPYFGAIPSALLILMINPVKCLTFIIFVLILQQIDGNIIGPKILGDSTGLSGFWVIFAITIFGGMWGVLGMIVGVPIFAVIYAGFKRYMRKRLAKKHLSSDTNCYRDLNYIDEHNEFVKFDCDIFNEKESAAKEESAAESDKK